ncbi:MmyB family transcriptional regulator [Herbiconiux liukaitaii]|uniref:MmyB family transcriptional regulator n=1 Tax=Herbiconiux liukaitaii TaxID=3342799 RepID=UPI0035B7C93F
MPSATSPRWPPSPSCSWRPWPSSPRPQPRSGRTRPQSDRDPKRLRHPLVGELTIEYEALALPGDPDQTLFVYTTEPGTAYRQAMDVLVSWIRPAAYPPAGAGADTGGVTLRGGAPS